MKKRVSMYPLTIRETLCDINPLPEDNRPHEAGLMIFQNVLKSAMFPLFAEN